MVDLERSKLGSVRLYVGGHRAKASTSEFQATQLRFPCVSLFTREPMKGSLVPGFPPLKHFPG